MPSKYWIVVDSEGRELDRIWTDNGSTPAEFDASTWVEVSDTGMDLYRTAWDGTNWVRDIIELTELRFMRNNILAACDWRDLPSYVGTDQAAWRTYRQALRDITVSYTPTNNPSWPTAPE
jgi:hypothetical protein